MFGFNGGYDSRPMNTGNAKPYHPIKNRYQHHFHPSIQYAKNPRNVFFQQVAAELEAVSSTWSFGAYALLPIGDTEQRLNSHYNGGALDTFGLDVGYFITPEINASIGYYYQQGDLGSADGSGVKGRLAFAVAKDVEFGGTYTYDNAFNARASADLTVRFGGGSHKQESTTEEKAINLPQIKSLSTATNNRDVRVHDDEITQQDEWNAKIHSNLYRPEAYGGELWQQQAKECIAVLHYLSKWNKEDATNECLKTFQPHNLDK